MDTIFALASAPGKAGVAVIRISGAQAFDVARRYCDLPPPRRAGVRALRDDQGERLDDALILTFEAGASFTGENVVEFHTHGSRAVVQAVLSSLASQPEARVAQPGEFTRRALDYGRMDLTQVEGLSDLLAAETEAQRRQAMQSMTGALKRSAETWRMDLIRAAALLEASIDFADEEVPEDVSLEVFDLIDRTQRALDAQLAGFSAAQSVRTGFEVAILGPPNAGKSTLLNALAGRDAAMTSDIAGTTRDIVEVRLDLGGLPVTMLDTAGIRHSEDRLEKMGVELAKARADAADLRIFVSCRSESMGVTAQNGDIFVDGKGDLAPNSAYPVSGATQLGLDRLLNDITTQLADRVQGAGLISHERQKQAMIWSAQALVEGAALVVRGPDVYDLAAEEIRSAVRALESLIGRVDVETVLGEIFSQFCVGK